jgi:hypothetical protein
VEWGIVFVFQLHLEEYYGSDKNNFKCFTACYLFKKLIITGPPNPYITCSNLVGTSHKALSATATNQILFKENL